MGTIVPLNRVDDGHTVVGGAKGLWFSFPKPAGNLIVSLLCPFAFGEIG